MPDFSFWFQTSAAGKDERLMDYARSSQDDSWPTQQSIIVCGEDEEPAGTNVPRHDNETGTAINARVIDTTIDRFG